MCSFHFVLFCFIVSTAMATEEKKADQLLSKKVKNFTFSHVSRVNNVIKCWILTWFFSLSVCVSYTNSLSWCAIQLCYSMARFFTPRATQKNYYYYTFFCLSFFQANNSNWHRQNETHFLIRMFSMCVLVFGFLLRVQAQTLIPWPYLFCIAKQIIWL